MEWFTLPGLHVARQNGRIYWIKNMHGGFRLYMRVEGDAMGRMLQKHAAGPDELKTYADEFEESVIEDQKAARAELRNPIRLYRSRGVHGAGCATLCETQGDPR